MSFTSIIAAVSLIAILVFIHEFGHFVAAKSVGIHVNVFSIGFGRRILGFKWRGTDYRLSLLPFGGYVQMAGADPFGYADSDEEPDDPSTSFQNQPVWKRLTALAAGPAFNLLLPIGVFTALLMAGEPQAASVVGTVDTGSPADQAGILSGDKIVAVAGTPVETWNDLGAMLSARDGGPVDLDVLRDGSAMRITVVLPDKGSDVDLGLGHEREDTVVGVADPASPAGRAGVRTGDHVSSVNGKPVHDWTAVARALDASGQTLTLGLERDEEHVDVQLSEDPSWTPVAPPLSESPGARWGLETGSMYIGSVGETVDDGESDILAGCRPSSSEPPSPAYLAGLRQGDRFLSFDGAPVHAWGDVLDAVKATMEGSGAEATARPLDVAVVRQGQVVHLSLTPTIIRDTDPAGQYYYRPILGVVRLGGYVDGDTTRIYYPFPTALKQAVTETWGLGAFIVGHIGKMLTGEAAVRKSLGGPIEMFRQASNAAQRGLFDWARLMGMLSISLGIVNLLPVPVLDGGQILFNAVEGVRGRPLSLALRERVQQVGLLFLVLLMLSVLVFDIQRIFEGPG